MKMAEERYEFVKEYLQEKSYPVECSKAEKRAIRKQALSFCIVSGTLHHKALCTNKISRVVVDVKERVEILRSIHSDPVGGGHFGQKVTFEKVSERYWWRGLSNDVRNYVQSCGKCQTANPSNKMPPAALHPIQASNLSLH